MGSIVNSNLPPTIQGVCDGGVYGGIFHKTRIGFPSILQCTGSKNKHSYPSHRADLCLQSKELNKLPFFHFQFHREADLLNMQYAVVRAVQHAVVRHSTEHLPLREVPKVTSTSVLNPMMAGLGNMFKLNAAQHINTREIPPSHKSA